MKNFSFVLISVFFTLKPALSASWVTRLFLLLSLIDASASWRQSASMSDNKRNKHLHSTPLVVQSGLKGTSGTQV